MDVLKDKIVMLKLASRRIGSRVLEIVRDGSFFLMVTLDEDTAPLALSGEDLE